MDDSDTNLSDPDDDKNRFGDVNSGAVATFRSARVASDREETDLSVSCLIYLMC